MTHTSARCISLIPVALVTAIVTLAGTSAGLSVHAQVRGESARVLQDKGPQGALQTIPTCEEAGLCRTERRMLFPGNNVRAIERLEARGCTVVHRLQDKVVLSCPRGLAVRDARPERAFRSQDILSATQVIAPAVWAQGITGNGVRVAVLDTGVEASHPEFQGRIAFQRNFTTSGSDDVHGHGTHVSGIVAAGGVYNIGTYATGVSTGAQLIVGKVCNDGGWCLEGDILAGIEWAVTENARVINMSLGGGNFGDHCDGDALAQKVNWAVERGVVVVAAAGNSGQGVGSPACASKAIAVGAVDGNDVRTSWSSWGQALDVVAPGVGIIAPISCISAGSCPGTWYARMSGTSMASPHVAGAAALLLQEYPHLTPEQVYTSLSQGARDLGEPGFDSLHGYGRIDASAALTAAAQFVIDKDGDDSPEDVDCNDADAAVYPGATEICNTIDDDCDGVIDEGFDADKDGVASCNNDCDESNELVFPGAPEICNGVDDDCNDLMDDSCRTDAFCGDLICNGNENAHTCALDCESHNAAKGKSSAKAICGDNVCEGMESAARCPADCQSRIPQRATDASGGKAGGSSTTNNGSSGGRGNANGGGNGNARGNN